MTDLLGIGLLAWLVRAILYVPVWACVLVGLALPFLLPLLSCLFILWWLGHRVQTARWR